MTAAGNVQSEGRGALRFEDQGANNVCCMNGPGVPWIVTEGAATVWVNGQPAAGLSHATTHSGGKGALSQAGKTVLLGGPSITMEEMARADALAMIDKAMLSLDRWNADDRAHFKEWFGTDSEEARNKMRERLRRIRKKLQEEDLVVGNDPGKYAHVWPFGNTVNLDDCFWTAPRTGKDSRAGTLVHETSHFWGAAGTRDYAYGRTKCRRLASEHPDKALGNADSYEYWLETLP
ncbi:MAG: M35 family metallo-endopeptidase [Byssovorax sp.]